MSHISFQPEEAAVEPWERPVFTAFTAAGTQHLTCIYGVAELNGLICCSDLQTLDNYVRCFIRKTVPLLRALVPSLPALSPWDEAQLPRQALGRDEDWGDTFTVCSLTPAAHSLGNFSARKITTVLTNMQWIFSLLNCILTPDKFFTPSASSSSLSAAPQVNPELLQEAHSCPEVPLPILARDGSKLFKGRELEQPFPAQLPPDTHDFIILRHPSLSHLFPQTEES